MRIKIEFIEKENGEFHSFETTIEENQNKVGNLLIFDSKINKNETFVYPIGGCKVYRKRGNILCAEEIELLDLNVDYLF